MIWHDIVWVFLKIYQDLQHMITKLFLFSVQNNFKITTCKNGKSHKSTNNQSSYVGLWSFSYLFSCIFFSDTLIWIFDAPIWCGWHIILVPNRPDMVLRSLVRPKEVRCLVKTKYTRVLLCWEREYLQANRLQTDCSSNFWLDAHTT